MKTRNDKQERRRKVDSREGEGEEDGSDEDISLSEVSE
jgi:hypothetical protein